MLTNFVDDLKAYRVSLAGAAPNMHAAVNRLDVIIADAERVMTQYTRRIKNLQEALGTNYPTAEEVIGASIAAIHEAQRLRADLTQTQAERNEAWYGDEARRHDHYSRDRSIID